MPVAGAGRLANWRPDGFVALVDDAVRISGGVDVGDDDAVVARDAGITAEIVAGDFGFTALRPAVAEAILGPTTTIAVRRPRNPRLRGVPWHRAQSWPGPVRREECRIPWCSRHVE
jgi:hypothetical protein